MSGRTVPICNLQSCVTLCIPPLNFLMAEPCNPISGGAMQPMKGEPGRPLKRVTCRVTGTFIKSEGPHGFHHNQPSPIVTLDLGEEKIANTSPSCNTIFLNKLLSKQYGRSLPTFHWKKWRETVGSRFFFFNSRGFSYLLCYEDLTQQTHVVLLPFSKLRPLLSISYF